MLPPGGPRPEPTPGSSHRFFAALLSAVQRVREATAVLRFVSAAVFVGGPGRIASWSAVGQPHALRPALLAVGLTGPPVLVVWRRRSAA